jgi:hypothetical protein
MRWPLLRALPLGLALLTTPHWIALQAQGFQTLRAEDAAAYVGQATGRPAVIVFYATSCPRSQAMFPSLVALANQYQSAGVDFLVFSTDDEADRERIPGFLAKHGAPFAPVYIERWAPGEFTQALAGVGIQAGKVWTRPLVAVRDGNGSIVAQAQGVTDVSPLSAALSRGE